MTKDPLRQAAHAALDSFLDAMIECAKASAVAQAAYRPTEAAARLGYRSAKTIHRLVADGHLRSVNGLIPEDSIQDLLGNKEVHRRKRA